MPSSSVADRIRIWRQKHVPDGITLLILSVVVGLCAGVITTVLHLAISWLTGLLTKGMHFAGANWQFLIYPSIGIVITSLFMRYVVKMNVAHGCDKILQSVKRKLYKIKASVIYSPIIGSTLTLGFGGSAGAEGPAAYSGAAVGSNLGRLLGLSPQMLMYMIGCGAGAGIAGIFKAPIGGVLFTLEVLRLQFSTVPVMALVTAAVCASSTAVLLSGSMYSVSVALPQTFEYGMLGWYLLFGLFCGIYSLYYSGVMDSMTNKLFRRISRPLIKNLTGGLILGFLLFLFPSLYGEGYGVMNHILSGNYQLITAGSPFINDSAIWQIAVLAMFIGLLKPFGCAAANSAGGVAGDFTPTLFAGCLSGLFFSLGCNYLFDTGLPVTAFAFLGMGAVMAGAVRAPLMSLFICVEMSGTYSMFIPMLIVTAVSFGVVNVSTEKDFYSLRQRTKNFFEKL